MAVISSEQYMSFLVPCVPICRSFSKNVILELASPMCPTRPLFAYKNVKMLSKAPQTQVLFAFVESTTHIIRNGDHNLEILNLKVIISSCIIEPIFKSHMSFRSRLATHNISPKCCNLPDVTQPLLLSRNHPLSNVIMQSRIT